MVERVIFAKGRKQGITYKLYKDEIIKRVKLKSDLRKLVVKWRAEYRENHLAGKGSAAEELENLLNDGGE